MWLWRSGAGIWAAGLLVFAIGSNLLPPGTLGCRLWANFWWTTAALAAALACLSAARRQQGNYRRAWVLFALGCGAWFGGMLVWSYLELARGAVTPFPATSDIGFLALAPLFAFGLFFYRSDRPTVALTLKDISEFTIISSALVIGSLLVLYQPLMALDVSPAYRTVALAYPVLYLGTLLYALLVLLSHDWRHGHMAILLLVLALALHAFTDTLYAYSLLVRSYQPGNYLDFLWLLAFAATFAAAQAERGAAAPEPAQATGRDQRIRRIEAFLPLALLITIGTIVMSRLDQIPREALYLATPFVILLVLALALREWAGRAVSQQLAQAAQQSAQQVRLLLESTAEAIYGIDTRGHCIFVNASFLGMLGYTQASEVLGRNMHELIHHTRPDGSAYPETECPVCRALREQRAGHRLRETFWRRDGSGFLAEVSVRPMHDDGQVSGAVVSFLDVTERQRDEAERLKLSSALMQTADAVMITDRHGVIEYVNPAFESMTGYSSAEVLGQRPSLIRSGRQGQNFYERMWTTILDGQVFSDIFINRRKDGSLFYESKTITPLQEADGHITHFISTGKDITEQIQAQERLQHMAHHDTLTGLSNRVLFLERATQSLARARWHRRLVAMLFMDLDRFKHINDGLGHEVGDKLLMQVSARLRDAVRDGDTVARFGGDEFVVLLDDIASEHDVAQLAQKFLEVLAPPFVIEGHELHISASIGVSLFPNDGEDSRTLLKHADVAMYRAKQSGKNAYRFYSMDMSTRAFERLTLEHSLRHALGRGEFLLHYQPQVDLASGSITGVEALLRWQHRDLGLVPPADFIPLLEETGLIVPVGEWVLATACAQARHWREAGHPRLRMAVNVSAFQLESVEFFQAVRRIMDSCGMSGAGLELEMTESALMRNAEVAGQVLDSLEGLGVRIAVDDFGTGYSSLGHLRRFHIDTLKIDRSFIRDISSDPDDAALAAAIIALANSLGLEVVAEGVETPAQLAFLRAQGCGAAQGYLFSRPAADADITRLLDGNGNYRAILAAAPTP